MSPSRIACPGCSGPQASGPKGKPFNARAFWSLLAALTLVGLPWTGIELHLHQADPLTFERHAWMAAHWTLAALFTAAVVAHAVLNFRALSRYARGLAVRIVPVSREAFTALVLTGALLLVGVGHTVLAGEGGRGRVNHERVEGADHADR